MPLKGIKYPRPKVMDGCEPPCMCQEQSLDPMQEHAPLSSGPSMQTLLIYS